VFITIEPERYGRRPRKAYRVDNTPPGLASLPAAGLDGIAEGFGENGSLLLY
jgi:hypothetical protein